jgi:hypothetical protein
LERDNYFCWWVGGALGLLFVRPPLPSMENGNRLQPLSPDPVWDDIGSFRHNQLARSHHAASPANSRVALKKVNGSEYAARHQSCSLFGVLLDVLSKAYQVPQRAPGPNDLHRGAVVSLGFPQDPSHFATFSWLTACSWSSSAMPACISPSCHSSEAT